MSGEIEKLVILVRLRRRELERSERVLADAAARHGECCAELRLRKRALCDAQERCAAAMLSWSRAPGDALVADYCLCERDDMAALAHAVEEAQAAEREAWQILDQSRRMRQRAQARLELFETRLAEAQARERQRLARRHDDALAETRGMTLVSA